MKNSEPPGWMQQHILERARWHLGVGCDVATAIRFTRGHEVSKKFAQWAVERAAAELGKEANVRDSAVPTSG